MNKVRYDMGYTYVGMIMIDNEYNDYGKEY